MEKQHLRPAAIGPEATATRVARVVVAATTFANLGPRPFLWTGKSHVCPLCHRFIAKNRSRVVRLPVPMPVQVERREGLLPSEATYVSSITKKAFYLDGHCPPDPNRPRLFAHADCYAKLRKYLP